MGFYLRLTALILLINIKSGHFVITFPKNGESAELGAPTLTPIDASLMLGLRTLDNVEKPNSVLSPVNLYACLWLLYSGARGDTKTELGAVLGAVGEESITSQLRQLSDVHAANAAFVDTDVTVRNEFVSAGDRSIFTVNFTDDLATRDVINGWVSEQTNGAIGNLLTDPVDTTASAVVVSAMYFNASWLYPFSPTATKLGNFELAPNETIKVPLMTREAGFPLFRGPSYNAVGLPYQDNGFTLYLLLPHAAGPRALKNMLHHLSPQDINKMVESMIDEPVIVTIPKLLLDFRIQLRPFLQSLGVNKMFDHSHADFGDLIAETAGSKFFVSEVLQSVHLEVDEGGTRGGAATAALLTKSSRWVFRANRPFAYLLRHQTGHVLFLGTVSNPLL